MHIESDRSEVIAAAVALMQANSELDAADAAKAALMDVYGLVDGDGIYGASPAAICMGYDDRDQDDNLLNEIIADVAQETATMIGAHSLGMR
jgi:hypothetical protein